LPDLSLPPLRSPLPRQLLPYVFLSLSPHFCRPSPSSLPFFIPVTIYATRIPFPLFSFSGTLNGVSVPPPKICYLYWMVTDFLHSFYDPLVLRPRGFSLSFPLFGILFGTLPPRGPVPGDFFYRRWRPLSSPSPPTGNPLHHTPLCVLRAPLGLPPFFPVPWAISPQLGISPLPCQGFCPRTFLPLSRLFVWKLVDNIDENTILFLTSSTSFMTLSRFSSVSFLRSLQGASYRISFLPSCVKR